MKAITETALLQIEIQGKAHRVPEGITAIQALWHAGHEMLKGVGCLGGVCGACTFTYSQKGQPGVKTGLACQTPVRDGMAFSPPAGGSQRPAGYRLHEIDDPASRLLQLYPEARRCTRCDACTLVCPQGIAVRQAVVQAISGDLAAVSEKFYNCIMCGLCAAVCDVSIQPNLLGIFARRTQGALRERPAANLAERLRQMQSGRYAAALQAVMQLDERRLRECDPDALIGANH